MLRLFKLAGKGFVYNLSIITNDMEGWFIDNQKLCRFVIKTENCLKTKEANKAQMVGL